MSLLAYAVFRLATALPTALVDTLIDDHARPTAPARPPRAARVLGFHTHSVVIFTVLAVWTIGACWAIN